MKRRISIIMLLIATLIFSLLAFTACGNDNDENGAKQVPVYQGMTITNSNFALSLASYRMSGITLLSANNENNGDNGNHYGHYKGDHTDRNDTIDEDNPYPDNNANENIEEEIKSSLNVVGSPDEIYYATPNEDIYINIHIDNPDSFEIMSFTLNGKKYSSYMFEEGSDMETIVLKYNVGDATGIVEYTIDAIKYIDGTEIKDVIIDGNKTVMAGIRTENQVVASVTDVDIDTNALSFNVNVKDDNALVEFSKGALKAVIYDGFNIISEKDIAVGNNSIIFDGLKTNTVYQYAVVGYYDNLSGNGFGLNVLYKDAFYTDSVVLFDDITVGQESVNFGFLWHEDHQGKAISALKLYKNKAFIKDITTSDTSIIDLLSNTTYTLVAEYQNGDNTESIYLEFTTLAKAIPEMSVVSPTKTQTSVGFEISETDADDVGAVTKIELVHANGTVVADSLDQRSFANLLSNNAYTVKVTYVYNLNDGKGEHTITKELNITTNAKAIPEMSVVSPNKTQTSVGFEISETDADDVGAVTKIELYKDGQLVETAANLDVRSFDGLLSNNTYTVKITYTYNLNDGTGNQTTEKNLNIKTNSKAVPSFAVKNENLTTDSVTAEYDIIDVDKILSYYKVELYKCNTLVLEKANKKIDFTGLDCYTNYTVKITCTYDLNDGNGEQTVAYDYAYKTLPYIDVVECNVANTSAVSEGETIFMSVTLDNPLGMSVESVVINGKTYSVTGASTKNRIFVEIVYNGQFAGGDTYLKIDKVNAKIDDVTLTAIPETEFSDNVFINGKLEVVKLEFVNDSFEKINYVLGDDPVYVLITLNNPTGYNIDKIGNNLSLGTSYFVDLIKLDNNRWYCKFDNYYSANTIQISANSISYSNRYIQRTVNINLTTDSLMIIPDRSPVYVSTPEDLKNMENLRYYILTNDIDLSGFEWRGGKFYGILEGNGYSIKNMSLVGTIVGSSAYVGLFSNADGIIKNLHIENATLIVDYQPDSFAGVTNEIFSGFFSGAGNACFYNCTVNDNSVLSIKCSNNASSNCYIGGFVGYSAGTFNNCSNSGNISGEDYVGGFVGYMFDACTLTNCINNGNVSSSKSAYVGGILGKSGISVESEGTIVNCINNGTVSVKANSVAGGIVGDFKGKIINCMNNGDVISENHTIDSSDLGAIAAKASRVENCVNTGYVTPNTLSFEFNILGFYMVGDGVSCIVMNSYSLKEFGLDNLVINADDCTVDQLNTREFYTETLGWSEDVWDFTELDVENGKYPKLKQ